MGNTHLRKKEVESLHHAVAKGWGGCIFSKKAKKLIQKEKIGRRRPGGWRQKETPDQK